ncbi:hypothetical protein QOT17_006607 [Balamuthia mandrillaris]
MLFLGSFIRGLFFALQPFIREGKMTCPNQVNIMLNSLPSFFFFSTYILLLFFWVELIYTTIIQKDRGYTSLISPPMPPKKGVQLKLFRTLYLFIVAVLFTIAVVLYIVDMTVYSMIHTDVALLQTKVEKSIWLVQVAVGGGTGIGFLISGIVLSSRLIQKGESWRLMSRVKRNLLKKVSLISAICTIGFTLRAVVELNAVIMPRTFAVVWWITLLYFVVLEIVPLVLILMTLILTHRREGTIGGAGGMIGGIGGGVGGESGDGTATDDSDADFVARKQQQKKGNVNSQVVPQQQQQYSAAPFVGGGGGEVPPGHFPRIITYHAGYTSTYNTFPTHVQYNTSSDD